MTITWETSHTSVADKMKLNLYDFIEQLMLYLRVPKS